MRTWTEVARVEHHWVMTNTERDTVLAVLEAAVDDPTTSPTEAETLTSVILTAQSVVSGPA